MTISELCENVERAVAESNEVINNFITDNSEQMIQMEHERLFSGLRADGNEIAPAYTLFTQSVKQSKGQPTDRVTLFDTGKFYGAFTVERHGDDLIFDSSDSKSEDLKMKYGEQIFGLTEDNKEALRERFREYFLTWFKQKIKL